MVLRGELTLLVEMIKRETEVALRTHFETFRNEFEGGLNRKVELKDVKIMLKDKVSQAEYTRELEHIKSGLYNITREMAVAGIGGGSGGGAQGPLASGASSNKNANAALRILVKQEMEGKVDHGEVVEMLKDKAEAKALRELIARQNNLESFVHKQFNVKGAQEVEVTKKLIEDAEESRSIGMIHDDDREDVEKMET